jgi:tRNA A37 threonylcarbamoyladenosine modification protein TsaB
MILQIALNVNDIKLTLKDGRKVIDEFSWIGEYSLSEQLLPNIDALLKKNKVKKEEIEKVVTKISKDSGVTSSRIVQTVAKAWNIAKELK